MEKGKKIIIILIIIILVAAGFLVYKRIKRQARPVPVENQSPSSSVNTIREKEFYDALKSASVSDQDLDAISDSDEAAYKTDPASSDTDGDGLNDWQEIFIYKTSPLKNDSDNDTFLDGYEVRRGFDPNGPGSL